MEKGYIWCGEREQRIALSVCSRSCFLKPFNCESEYERGINMALGAINTTSAKGISEEFIMLEMRKLNEHSTHRFSQLKDLIIIMDDKIKGLTEKVASLEKMLQRPNVLSNPVSTTTTKKPDIISSGNKVTMTDKEIVTLANSVQKENGMEIFIEAFRSKYPKGFQSEEDCIKATYEMWKEGSKGHANSFWAARSNKAMQAIICKAFVSSAGKVNTETTKEKDADYFIKTFSGVVTGEKLQALAQLIEDNVSKKELVKLTGNTLFDSQSRTFILEYFNEDKSKRLDKVYPAEEIKAFLNFLTQFVVREE